MARMGGGWVELGGDPGGLMLVTSNWQLVIGDVRPVIVLTYWYGKSLPFVYSFFTEKRMLCKPNHLGVQARDFSCFAV
jgi:hypothetical protein